MSQREGLAGLRDEIATCMRCGNCQAVCPVYREVRREPAVARGKVALAEALLAGQIEPDKELARQLDLCLTCKACVDACPSGVRVDDIILAARAEIVQRRGMPWLKAAIFGAVKRPRILDAGVTMATKMQGLVMADGPEDGLGVPRLPIDSRRRPVLPKLPAEPLRTGESSAGRIPHPVGRVVFYPGCMVSYVYPAIGRALIAVLRTASVEVLVPPTAQCCGLPMLMHGDVATAQEMARATIEGLERLGGDAVLTACPTCGSALKHHMTHLLRDDADWAPRATRLAARAMDASEYLVDRLELPSAATRSAMRVTYHDPCHLARGQGVRTQPRELIERVAGLDLAELATSEVCCGGAGSFLLTHSRLAAEIGARKAAEIEATGAEIVVTSCPGCRLQLTDSLRRRGRRQRVCHTIEILAEASAPRGRSHAAARQTI